jgi:VanZ family protein
LLVHFFVFGVVTIITFLAFGHPILSGLVVLGFSALIEVMQLFVPGRDGSLEDLGANAFGVAIAVVVVMVVKRVRGLAKAP